MKKFTLAFCLWFALAAPATAMDSTALSNPAILGTNIQKASGSGVPVGTIIAWSSTENPEDAENWLECNGQSISPSVYLELFAIVGSKVPDMRNQFMRGGTSAQVGQVATDSTRSHAHAVDQHSHTVGGQATGSYSYSSQKGSTQIQLEISQPNLGGSHPVTRTSMSMSDGSGFNNIDWWYETQVGFHGSTIGTKVGQNFNYYRTVLSPGYESFLEGIAFLIPTMQTSTEYFSANVDGYTNVAGPTATHATGSAETAPQHIRVRYLIRALP